MTVLSPYCVVHDISPRQSTCRVLSPLRNTQDALWSHYLKSTQRIATPSEQDRAKNLVKFAAVWWFSSYVLGQTYLKQTYSLQYFVPSGIEVKYRTLIGSYTLPVERNGVRAAAMTGSARNRLRDSISGLRGSWAYVVAFGSFWYCVDSFVLSQSTV